MSISIETVVSVIIGGLITWGLAHLYFKKQDKRAEQIFEATARFLESLGRVVTQGGGVRIEFTRDARNQILGARTNYTETARDGAIASDSATATVTRKPVRTDTGTKQGQNPKSDS